MEQYETINGNGPLRIFVAVCFISTLALVSLHRDRGSQPCCVSADAGDAAGSVAGGNSGSGVSVHSSAKSDRENTGVEHSGSEGGGGRNEDFAPMSATLNHGSEGLAGLRYVSRYQGAVARAQQRSNFMKVTYTDGWNEQIKSNRYSLIDPENRVVAERLARDADYHRLDAAIRDTLRYSVGAATDNQPR